MLELQNIKKYYQTGDLVTKALDGVSVTFRESEFVSILGESGSGKTTMLNVIGGLDTYDQGNMIINGQSTQNFTDAEWDAYRNNSIGFVFQSYNLISHLTVLDNVELGMTLSNVSQEERRQRSEEALEEVGLLEHKHKKPSQLSGGQMQRVAIARALANDPDILLCDEPTGALDSETGVQVMELIKEVSKDRLVIMVTHNSQLARQYSDRIIRFHDGQILTDSKAYDDSEAENKFDLRKTKMTFWTALQLSFNNLRTKKAATALTSFAASIGIISIAIVLSLSNGFQVEINNTQRETLAQFPITIGPIASNPQALADYQAPEQFPDSNNIIASQPIQEQATHFNKITDDFIEHIQAIDPALTNNIGYGRTVKLNLVRQTGDNYQQVSFSSEAASNELQGQANMQFAQSTGIGVSTFPENIQNESSNFLANNYDLLAGDYPTEANDIILVTETDNSININSLINLGFDVEDGQEINFEEILGTEILLVSNDDYYQELPTGNFIPQEDYEEMAQSPDTELLTISGILRPKEDSGTAILASGIAYSDELNRLFIENNQGSQILAAQEESDRNVFTNEAISEQEKEGIIASLAGQANPSSIYLYPNDFESKDEVISYLDSYNEGKDSDDQIIYTDLASAITEITGSLLNGITIALVAFAAISLITSTIMIGIITYNSVIQRTKEIGILKALGARKKDITRVFDSENFILGVFTGIFGVGIAYLLTIPLNSFIEDIAGIANVAKLDPIHAGVLVIIAVLIHLIGGHIPAKMAAKQNAAVALRAD